MSDDLIRRSDATALAIKLASSKWKESYIRKVFDELLAVELCEDAISREVAIQTTWMILNGMGYPKDQNENLDQTIKAVFNTAPRVAPSIPKGEWIDDNNYANCSLCGLQINVHENRGYHNFCPNCGAKMFEAEVK